MTEKEFPPGPFFNFRTFKEFPWHKKLIWKCFGVKRVGVDSNYLVTAYYFRGVTFISEVKEL